MDQAPRTSGIPTQAQTTLIILSRQWLGSLQIRSNNRFFFHDE